jgi:glycolate oxidase FAD binding subunit
VDTVVDVSGMDRILDHAAGDLVVQVQAGVPLAELAAALAPAGQRLAIDEVVAGSTIGGVLATGLTGPLRASHGGVRDLVLGVTVVLADGRCARAGGRVVKNVAGFDLSKLYTGSFGTLGVITEAFLRLHPVPERTAWVTVEDLAEADSLWPAAVEVHAGPGVAPELVALLEGTDRGVEGRLAGRAEAARPSWWGGLPGLGEGETLLKLTTVRSAVPALVESCRRLGVVAVTGSAAAGILWAGVAAGTPVAEAVEVLQVLRAACARYRGSASALRAGPALRDATDAWGPVPALALMRRVKDEFDPGPRLAPGCFVGGI